jgi:hypothetical protein
MNAHRLGLTLIVGICAVSWAWADAPMIFDTGDGCGAADPVLYSYLVDSVSYPMMEFRVGTNDLDTTNYWDVVMPPGWQFAVEPNPMHHACGLCTEVGEMPEGPCYGFTPGHVRWWTDDPELAVEYFTFSFYHPWSGEDVGWELTTRREGPPPEYYVFCEWWDTVVGLGYGPVHGPWGEQEYCWDNGMCDPDEYCLFQPCAAETGICTPRPEACPDVWEPVCGCDGVTYGNACYAAMAGMSVDYPGPCEGDYCWSNRDCPPEEYCLFDDCAAETGMCTPRPDACPDVWDPVCGCDGVTYSNACYAAMAGQTVDYPGECEPQWCWSNEDCTPDKYCYFEDCAAETGVCMPRPEACPDVWDPVCGCDGVTYSNACYAAMAGMSVDYPGPCDGDYCWSNQDCPIEQYCYFEECAAETGVCVDRPDVCPDVWDPVCGCDGVTYSNACYAAMAGESVDYPGPCVGPPCWSNDDCPPDQYCEFEPCAIETGFCALRPEACPDIWDPVCGCDALTYPSACDAALSGMSVDYPGECMVSCMENPDCEETHYCEYPLGECEGPGTCEERPDIVPPLWDPVCGCDRQTYPNEWVAALEGVSVAYYGECMAGDINLDGFVDLLDYELLYGCLYGPGQGIPLDCADADLDGDIDVDLGDFTFLMEHFGDGGPRIGMQSYWGCTDPGMACVEEDETLMTVQEHTLDIVHNNVTYNCCLDDIEVTLTVEGNVLHLDEVEIAPNPCYCICCYGVGVTIFDLTPGEYTVEYCWFDYEYDEVRCYTEGIVVP